MSQTATTKLARVKMPLTKSATGEPQAFTVVRPMPIVRDAGARHEYVEHLNQLLADTIVLRDLYKKHHWQVSGVAFHQLHPLFNKHAGEQSALVDLIAERVMMLGGVCVAMAADVAEMTLIPRPPRGRETVPVQISRLLHAHEVLLLEARTMARLATALGDTGTSDLLVSAVIRTNEKQGWFVAEHGVEAIVTGSQ